MKKEIVIFGASKGARKVLEIFRSMHIEIAFLVDNDRSKWGTKIEEYEIYAPKELIKDNYEIVIASVYQDEIESQLKQMGLLDNVRQKEYYILEYALLHFNEVEKITTNYMQRNKSENVFIDLLDEGIILDGAVNWALLLLKGLREKEISAELLCKQNKETIKEEMLQCVQLFDMEYSKYWENIKELLKVIFRNLPCTIITNTQNQALIAGALAKKIFPEEVKIFSVVHNDRKDVYRRQAFLEGYTDRIICVSSQIYKVLFNIYGMEEKKLFYKETPIVYKESIDKEYSAKNMPIRIGFAARIQKSQKRVDLLPELVEILEKKKVNYQLNIAGTGTYFEELKIIVKENEYQRVALYGRIEKERMGEFWMNNDLFLSLSDHEGASLSMLEAMSYGCIPITTRTSGVDEFVQTKVSGFSVDLQDVFEIADIIENLANNRNLLPFIGNNARKVIKEKCNICDYLEQFITMMREIGCRLYL